MPKPKPAIWWFAWYPVRTADTHKLIWLKRVYRERWFDKLYFEKPTHSQGETE